jgi:hypothetical protein
MAPACYALVLVRGSMSEWDVEEMKGFEDATDAERWARAMARDATTPADAG